MRLEMPGGVLERAMAVAIVGHARLAATPFDQLAMTVAFDLGRAIVRAARHAAGAPESQHAAL